MAVFRDFLICVPATVFFAVLFKVPKGAVWISGLLGGAGYAIFELVSPPLQSPIAGYFVGTLAMAACSEILARAMKRPATVFLIPAIIPLVPGVGLYDTMQYLVQGQNVQAARTGVATLLAIIAMAMAMVLMSIVTRSIAAAVASLRRSRLR